MGGEPSQPLTVSVGEPEVHLARGHPFKGIAAPELAASWLIQDAQLVGGSDPTTERANQVLLVLRSSTSRRARAKKTRPRNLSGDV